MLLVLLVLVVDFDGAAAASATIVVIIMLYRPEIKIVTIMSPPILVHYGLLGI